MSDQLTGKDSETMTAVIDGKEIIIESGTLVKTMDTCADGFTCLMPWIPGKDPDLDKKTKYLSYSPVKIYIGNDLASEQVLFDVTQKLTKSGNEKELECWSKTAHIIDSTMQKPYEANNISLTDRCKQLCSPFSISVFVGEDAAKSINETRKTVTTVGYKNVKGWRKHDNILLPTVNRVAVKKSSYITDEKKFPRVKAEPTDTIFEHLSKLATQRGVLLSCTKDGDLLIDKFNPQSDIVGTIEEGVSPLAESYELKISGRDRFATYRVKVKSSSSKKAAYIQEATDPRIVAPRVILMDADDAIPGEAKDAAVWKRNKKAADALSFPFDVTSWYAPNGTLWRPNTRLTIISETMGIKNGFTFLITKVVYKFEKSGSTATLTLVPPTVYSNGDIEEPW